MERKRKKRSGQYKREKIHALLASHGHYNMDYGRVVGTWKMPDASYRYRAGPFHRFCSFFVRLALAAIVPVYLKLAYGAKVTGRENLKAIKGKGAICLCNHFHILDILFMRQAVGHFRTYQTVAPFNNKGGVLGMFMHCGGILPFSADLAAMRNFEAEIGRLLRTGKAVCFCPERALWTHYPAPRPMQRGAFRYAVKFNVPALPIFCTFRERKGRIRKLRIHILPAVFPDETLPSRAREREMLETAEREWQACFAENSPYAVDNLPAKQYNEST